MPQRFSKYLTGLEPWQYTVSKGYKARGYYTPPTGKPLLHFIHGNGFCGLVYEKMLGGLQQHFDLFISDAQGHGESAEGSRFVDWDQSAQNFVEVWEHFAGMWAGVPSVALGHSFGAVNSLLMMHKRPGLFDQAVLLDPVIGKPLWTKAASLMQVVGVSKFLPMVRQASVRKTTWDSEEELWSYFYQRGIFKGWDDDCLRSYLDHALSESENGSFELKCPPRIEAAIFASYSKNIWNAVSVVDAPINVIVGTKTYPFIHGAIDLMESKGNNLQCHEFEGGHCFMQEKPERSAELIWNLLS
jgi:pimeloyl-ACP methyl ester carboxylesterase